VRDCQISISLPDVRSVLKVTKNAHEPRDISELKGGRLEMPSLQEQLGRKGDR